LCRAALPHLSIQRTLFNMKSSRSLALVSLFAALMAVFGLIPKIDLPLGVPITLQTLGVMLAGCLLGPRRGLQAMLLFLAAVALGLPLLSGGRGGFGVFMAPSAGYLLAWPLGAWVTGLLMAALPASTPRSTAFSAFLASAVGGLLMVHACGVVGLVKIASLSWTQAFFGTLVFVPGDLIKCGICALVVHTVARGLPDWQFGGRALK
jgi:biotin transport system substrate-specific component